jgi:hypothetical protein
MQRIRYVVLVATLLLVAMTAFGLNGARQAHAEPPDPCLHFALCSE